MKEIIETPPAARMSTDEERILYVKTILLTKVSHPKIVG